jgi:hypothetical protein
MNAEAVRDALVRHSADETTCAFFDDRLACDTALYYPTATAWSSMSPTATAYLR